ncbi:MAG: hypothetical protein RLZZ301_1827 [Bacteroidota bacterium]|jgi:uncharacterized YccA/Bax inhibitor family protein
MKKILASETLFTTLGYLIGALGGYIYFLLFPCTEGCALNRSPIGTILVGLFAGGLVFQFIYEFLKSKHKKDVKNNH